MYHNNILNNATNYNPKQINLNTTY